MKTRLRAENALFWGAPEAGSLDDRNNSAWRLDEVERAAGVRPGRVLDMAAGCGTFVLGGLLRGWECFGVEPADWKQRVVRLKSRAMGYPPGWVSCCVGSVGE